MFDFGREQDTRELRIPYAQRSATNKPQDPVFQKAVSLNLG